MSILHEQNNHRPMTQCVVHCTDNTNVLRMVLQYVLTRLALHVTE